MRARVAFALVLAVVAAGCGGNQPRPHGAPALGSAHSSKRGVIRKVSTIGTAQVPVVGELLSTTPGTWTNTPTSYSYQWQRCQAACTPITGATSSSYTIVSADVGNLVQVKVTASNAGGSSSQTSQPTGVVSDVAGTLRFNGTAMTSISPWSATGGGAQCHNYGTASINGRWRGNLYFVTWHGLPAGQFSDDDASNPNPNTTTYYDESCAVNGPLWGSNTWVAPRDEYFAWAVWVPNPNVVPNSTGRTLIAEFHHTSLSQPAVNFHLENNAVQYFVTTGAYNTGGCGCFQYSAAGSVQHLPLTYAIPPGQLALGQWNEILFHAHWATDTSGVFETFYRAQGGSWHAGSRLSGIPTVGWTAPSTYPTTYSDDEGNYGASFTGPYSIYLTSIVDGTSWASVLSQLP